MRFLLTAKARKNQNPDIGSSSSGVIAVQLVLFFKLYPQGAKSLKAFVRSHSLWPRPTPFHMALGRLSSYGIPANLVQSICLTCSRVLDFLQTAMVWSTSWFYLIRNFGDVGKVDVIPMCVLFCSSNCQIYAINLITEPLRYALSFTTLNAVIRISSTAVIDFQLGGYYSCSIVSSRNDIYSIITLIFMAPVELLHAPPISSYVGFIRCQIRLTLSSQQSEFLAYVTPCGCRKCFCG